MVLPGWPTLFKPFLRLCLDLGRTRRSRARGFQLGLLGRGEVLRLLFEDAQIKFKDVRFGFGEANSMSSEERAKYNPVISLPSVEIGGKQFTQSYPTLRHFSRKLGKYDGKTDEERYFVDVICDIALDWRTRFVDSAFVTDQHGLNPNADSRPFEHHKSFFLPRYIKGIEKHLSTSSHSASGPFVLGTEITYADLVVWQISHDESEIGGGVKEILDASAPRLKQLLEAVAARPNIEAYQRSDRYYN